MRTARPRALHIVHRRGCAAQRLCRLQHDARQLRRGRGWCAIGRRAHQHDDGLSDRYVSRLLRLAWLDPNVLERLVVGREPCAIRLYDLCFIASLPWGEQTGRVFD